MSVNTVEHIFDEIMLLPPRDRDSLFIRIKDVFYSYSEEKPIAYTVSGNPLTRAQYQKRVQEGIYQCREGKYTSLEQLSETLGYNYEDL